MWVVDCRHVDWSGIKTFPMGHRLIRGCEILAVRYLPWRKP